MSDALIEGTAVAIAADPDGPLAGVLLLGPSGAGKSSLALSIIEECPWRRSRLVADDILVINTAGGDAIASAPEKISGQIELRGFGPVAIKYVKTARLRAAFTLGETPSRLPTAGAYAVEGVDLPHWPFAPGRDDAGRIRTMLRAILAGQLP